MFNPAIIVIALVILGLHVSMLTVTCLQHWYHELSESHHSIFEMLHDNHQHSKPLGEEDHCQLMSATEKMLLVLVECKPCVMPVLALLPPNHPSERFTPISPLVVLKVYHSPPVKPPTLQTS